MSAVQFGERIPGQAYPRRPGAYAVMFNDRGQIGLIQAGPGCFLPGGGIEPGEEPETALQRELVEETGHTVTGARFIGTASRFGYAANLGYFESYGYFYVANFGERRGEKSEPDRELIWVEPERAAGLLRLEHQAWAVGLALKQTGSGNGDRVR